MRKFIVFLFIACLLGQSGYCICDAACATRAETAAREAAVDSCSGCCQSKQDQDDTGGCGCAECAETKPSAEAISASSPGPEVRANPACSTGACLATGLEPEHIPCADLMARPPSPTLYLLFEVLLT